MAKGGSKRQRQQTQSGGMGATEWVNNLLGNGWQQFQNSLMTQPGSNLGSVQSNQIVPNDGSKGVYINDPKNDMPNPNGSPQNGGKTRRKGKKSRGKKGGMLGVGAVLEQAVVPFGLFGLQQSYGKSRRHHGSKRSRRSRRFRR